MKAFSTEVKVGFFVTVGVGLILLAILVLGSTENMLQRKNHYVIHFTNVEGLIPGAKIVLDGVQVGTVDDIDFDLQRRDVLTTIAVVAKYTDWVRKDTFAEISTQGVLGDKYVILTPGSPTEPVTPPGGEIQPRMTEGLTQFINKGDKLMASLQSIATGFDRLIKKFEVGNRSDIFFQGLSSTAKNLSSASEKLNHELEDLHLKTASRNLNLILEKVNNGTGTLGALVNDPGLYDDVRALMGGANRNRIVRNLVRQTVKKGEQAEAQEKKAQP